MKSNWDDVVRFGDKAVSINKYRGGTAAAVKVLIKDVGDLLQSDEPREYEYIIENVEEILNRNKRDWKGPTFSVYFNVFKRLLNDFRETAGNPYKIKSSAVRGSRKRAETSKQAAGEVSGNGVLDLPSKGHRIAIDLPKGPITVTLPYGITTKDWEHVKTLVDNHVRYLLESQIKEEVLTN